MAISTFESAIYRNQFRDADMAALFSDLSLIHI